MLQSHHCPLPLLLRDEDRREGHCYEHGRTSGEGEEYRCHRPPSVVTPPTTSLLTPPEKQERHRLAVGSARLLLLTNRGPRTLLRSRRSMLGTREMTPLLHRKKGGRHGRTRRRRSLLHREEECELRMLPQLETGFPHAATGSAMLLRRRKDHRYCLRPNAIDELLNTSTGGWDGSLMMLGWRLMVVCLLV
nr:hypothetical protein Itr_chr13CG16670 [Ipomoea trifida]